MAEAKSSEAKLAQLASVALDALEDGLVVLDAANCVVVWNCAAESISGYPRAARIGRCCPEKLYELAAGHEASSRQREDGGSPGHGHFLTSTGGSPWLNAEAESNHSMEHAVLVEMRHAQGHLVPAMLKRIVLRDEFGGRLGELLSFYPAEDTDQLPHGETGGGAGVEQTQADMEDRLEAAFRAWETTQIPFGLMWITVDQAAQLRKTHGREASEAMLHEVEKALRRGLRPAEVLGRWGDNEFLAISHERTAELLIEHGQHLAGVGRTAEFRWWGDRIGLTLSIGVAQSGTDSGDSLSALLKHAQKAMEASVFAGGNHVSRSHG